MPGSEGNAGKESPFFALEPIIVLDVVGVRKQRVQGEEREGV
jgi:hypothetical protein